MTYDPDLVLDEADNPTPAHHARANALLKKGLNTMPKTKLKPAKKKRTSPYPKTNDVLRFMANLLAKSRDVNQVDKLALAELVKHLKD